MQKQKIICLVGPTAVGKTSFSITFAKALKGEIVSADSRQVYRGLDIGSGKVTVDEMDVVPHHLLDIADPCEVFTASDFVREGRKAIVGILERGNVPIVVGGTGFYVDALVGRVALADVPPNEELRAKLRILKIDELRKELATLDPNALERMDTQNPVRLIRAIEIATALGKVELKKGDEPYDILWIGIVLPMNELKERIQARLTARLSMGMLKESQRLHQEGLSYERMEELGLEYRYMARYLQGLITYEEMIAELDSEIIKYAKRQMTWFRKNPHIHWFHPNESETVIKITKNFLK